LPLVGVDVPAALEHDEELVAIVMPVALVPRPRFEHGPTDHVIGARRSLVDQELHLHIDPAVLALETRDLGPLTNVGAIHFRGGGRGAPGTGGGCGAGFSFGLPLRSLHHRSSPFPRSRSRFWFWPIPTGVSAVKE